MSNPIKKLEELNNKTASFYKLADGLVSKEDFVKAFRLVLEVGIKIKEQANEAIQFFRISSSSLFEKLKQDISEALDKFERKIDAKIATLKDGEKGEKGEPGISPDPREVANLAKNEAIEAVKPLIPTIEAITDNLPKLGQKIRDGLELLQGEQKLSMEAIDGLLELKKEIEELKKRPIGRLGGGGGTSDLGVAMSMSRIVRTVTPTGLINGTNKVYTVPSAINAILSFGINGEVIHDTDYTISNSTITFATALPAALAGKAFRIVYI